MIFDSLTSDVDDLPRVTPSNNAIEAITIFMDGGSTGRQGTTNSKPNYNVTLTNVNNDDYLKLEIFYTNHNSTLSKHIANIPNVQFKQPGAPGPVSSLVKVGDSDIQIAIRFTSPNDHDSLEGGNQSTPLLASSNTYQITYESDSLSTGVSRFGGVQNHSTQTIFHTHTGSDYQSQQNKTLTSLKPGQTYSVSVSAKNSINSSYGSSLTETFDTAIPDRPSLFSSQSLSKSVSTYPNSGRTLSSQTSVSSIVRRSELPNQPLHNGNGMTYNTITFAINEENSNLESNIHSFETSFVHSGGDTTVIDTDNFPAFSSTMTYANSANIFSSESNHTNTKLVLSNQEDAYSTSSRDGFWARITSQLSIDTTSLTASDSSYTVRLTKIIDGSETTLQDTFHIDDLTANPEASGLTHVSFPSDSNGRFISGIPSRGNSFQLKINLLIQNLGRHFVRVDRFANLALKIGNSSYGSTTIPASSYTSSSSFVYEDGTSPVNEIDSSKKIKFENLTLTYNDPSTGIYTNITSDGLSYLKVSVIPQNILSSGGEVALNGINTSTNEFSDSEQKIYVDTVSIRYLNSHYNDKSSTSGTFYPRRQHLTQWSESESDTPTVSQSSHHETYNDESSLTSTTYQQELQFANGRFRTKHSSNDAYYDYPTTFLDHSSLGSMTDYSGISNSGYRFATFKYELNATHPNPSTISYIDLNLIDFTLPTMEDTGTVSDFKLFVKIIEDDDYSVSSTNYTSIWIDGNSVLQSAVARDNANYANTSLEPIPALQNASSGNTTSSIKRVVLVPGTPTNNLTILVRVGLRMNQNMSIGRIELQCPSS